MANCHFVTRFLTKPWEHSGGSLCYYDFEKKELCRGFSKSLFAEDGLNSGEIEALINEYVERPLAGIKPEIVDGTLRDVSDWKTYRALFLYFMIQTQRFGKARLAEKEERYQTQLDEFLKRGEGFLDSMVQIKQLEYMIAWVGMPDGIAMFFPETGFFQFPVEDDKCITGYTIAYAFPITPKAAVVMVPLTVNRKKLLEQRGWLQEFSIGLNQNASKVLIAKEVLDYCGDEKVKLEMEKSRESATTLMKNILELRQKTWDLYKAAGFEVRPISDDIKKKYMAKD